ncbi:MAG: hypothetical protein HZB16_11335 [Armatimonadetes bacterium]|nr:hypothetical protein [Armatimonadota bacterium]
MGRWAHARTTLVDPQGRCVTLADDTWARQFLVGHPELARYRAWVEAAITAPAVVTESANRTAHPTGVQYYGPCGRAGLLIMVATEEVRDAAGAKRIVKTAHLVKRVGNGSQLWP